MIFTFCQKMLLEQERLETEIKSIQEQIRKLPPGKLVCSHNGNRFKWYQSSGHKQTYTYIPKSNRKLAEQLAVKQYLLLLEKELLKQQKAVASYLTTSSANNNAIEQLFSDSSGYAELLSSYFKPLSQELSDWTNEPYEHNTKYPEQLIHRVSSGIKVRSKSEAMIATLLYINKIPFRYECALQLGDATVFPDFTIRHPHTGQIYYWEHFGMMDNPSYCQKALSKQELYISNKIFPSINLLTTYETKDNPLNTDLVENMLRYYFV